MSEREYTGSVYLAVIEGETQYGQCRDSVEGLIMRREDVSRPAFYRGTKGYQGRQRAIDDFMKSKHDFIAMLDGDMIFEPDCIERLRRHKLPYVSGFYPRRSFAPLTPVWFRPFGGEWPHDVLMERIESGKLYELGASGWGLILIHRDVITAVRAILKGEPDVIEDDMDIWPYDLRAVIQAIEGLNDLVEQRPDVRTLRPALAAHVATLRQEIRPLRADKALTIGSDIRFPWYAKQAGFVLYGDPDARARHMVNYPVSLDDVNMQPDEVFTEAAAALLRDAERERAELRADREALYA